MHFNDIYINISIYISINLFSMRVEAVDKLIQEEEEEGCGPVEDEPTRRAVQTHCAQVDASRRARWLQHVYGRVSMPDAPMIINLETTRALPPVSMKTFPSTDDGQSRERVGEHIVILGGQGASINLSGMHDCIIVLQGGAGSARLHGLHQCEITLDEGRVGQLRMERCIGCTVRCVPPGPRAIALDRCTDIVFSGIDDDQGNRIMDFTPGTNYKVIDHSN